MLLGVIKISLRSTRVWAADVGPERSSRLLGREHQIAGRQENVERLTALLMAEVEVLRDLGVSRIEVIASPELRGSRLIRLLDRVSTALGTGRIRIPSRRESAAAAFLTATVPRGSGEGGTVTVARIGETGVEVAVGSPTDLPDWFGSRPVGTTAIARKARFSDPPQHNQVEAAFRAASRSLATLSRPEAERAFAISPLAAEVEALCGRAVGPDEARRGLASIRGEKIEVIEDRFALSRAAVRRIVPTLILHGALSEALAQPVEPVAEDPAAGRSWLAELDRSVADGWPG